MTEYVSKTGHYLKYTLGLALGLLMIFAAYRLTDSNPPPGEQVPSIKATVIQDPNRADKLEFLDEELDPILSKELLANRQAIRRAKKQLEEQFSQYSSRLPAFADELMSLGVKWKLTKATAKDFFNENKEAGTVVSNLFDDLVVSDAQLTADMVKIVSQFTADLGANRNEMLVSTHTRIKASQLPLPRELIDLQTLTAKFQSVQAANSNKMGHTIPVVTVLAFAGGSLIGYITEEAVEKIVTQFITKLAKRIPMSVVAAGGGAAAGAAGGTAVWPGVGTLIGFAAGWWVEGWMEDRFKEKVIEESRGRLLEVQNDLWKNPTNPKQGLEAVFEEDVLTNYKIHWTIASKLILEE